MEYEVVLSSDAKHDLFDIYYYVAVNDSFDNADKLYNKLFNKCISLRKFPKRGSKVEEIYEERPDILQIVVSPFIILYKIERMKVLILAIFDGRRDLNSVYIDRFI